MMVIEQVPRDSCTLDVFTVCSSALSVIPVLASASHESRRNEGVDPRNDETVQTTQ